MNKNIQHNEIIEYAVSCVGDIICGFNIANVNEINKYIKITKVHGAPECVRGVINLRGKIVTVIDLRIKLGMEPLEIDEDMRIVVVRSKGEDIGLLVDNVDDILPAKASEIESTPYHMHQMKGRFFSSVFKLENDLVAIVDIEKVLE